MRLGRRILVGLLAAPMGLSSYWRSVYAVRAWRETRFRELILTGDRSTTDAMRRFLSA